MSTRRCESCDKPFPAASARSRFCSNTCRSRAHRARGGKQQPEQQAEVRKLRSVDPAAPMDDIGASLTASLERQLREAGRLDTWQGQGAVTLARRIDASRDTGSAIASLHRELRAAVTEALKGVGTTESAVTRHRNELAERRAARRAHG